MAMGKGNFSSSWFLLHKITMTKFHGLAAGRGTRAAALHVIKARSFSGSSNTKALLKQELQSEIPGESSSVCICKIPNTFRQVKSKAYQPSIVSIGPYHHGLPSLQEMEKLKRVYFHRVFKPKPEELDQATEAMQKLEEAARSCYSEESKLCSEEFVKMMLIDGCFIVELLRDSMQQDFVHTPSTIKRWMLPTLRQDLIKLENQLPLFVLRELFQLTARSSCFSSEHEQPASLELEALALRFINPLLQGHLDPNKPLEHFTPKQLQAHEGKHKHFLHLFHHSIRPDHEKGFSTLPWQEPRGKQTQLIRSIQELKEAGVKLKTDMNRQPLDISFRSTLRGKVLTIPQIHINDHRGTLFRNLLAFEKCHRNCHQDVTSYLFFLDGLINSSKDVGLLHYHGVLQHSLGSNRSVAKLVNNLCKEVGPDASQTYLYRVIGDANFYYDSKLAKVRAALVHHYLSSWVVGISTLGGILALYLTLIQTGCGVAAAKKDLEHKFSFGAFLKDSLFITYLEKILVFSKDLEHKFYVGAFLTDEDSDEDNDEALNAMDWPHDLEQFMESMF
ncbi:hypothetical protein EV1_031641 [Malus domestica]